MNNWSIVDSVKMNFTNPQMKWGYYKLFTKTNLSLYSVGLRGCWKFSNLAWENLLFYDGVLYDISGESDIYLIVCSAFKTLKFFNGSTWQNFSENLKVYDANFVFKNVWTNGYETFICGYGNFGAKEKLVVWRGK
jgi:hypothetical protein